VDEVSFCVLRKERRGKRKRYQQARLPIAGSISGGFGEGSGGVNSKEKKENPKKKSRILTKGL